LKKQVLSGFLIAAINRPNRHLGYGLKIEKDQIKLKFDNTMKFYKK
jgi:hypothetical protein